MKIPVRQLPCRFYRKLILLSLKSTHFQRKHTWTKVHPHVQPPVAFHLTCIVWHAHVHAFVSCIILVKGGKPHQSPSSISIHIFYKFWRDPPFTVFQTTIHMNKIKVLQRFTQIFKLLCLFFISRIGSALLVTQIFLKILSISRYRRQLSEWRDRSGSFTPNPPCILITLCRYTPFGCPQTHSTF